MRFLFNINKFNLYRCDSSLMIGNTKNLNIIDSDIIMLAVNETELG